VQAAAADGDWQPAVGLVLGDHGRQQEAAPAQPEVEGPLPTRLQDGGQVDVRPPGPEQRRTAVAAGDVRPGARPERAVHQAVHRHLRLGHGQLDQHQGVVPVLREDGSPLCRRSPENRRRLCR